MQGNGTQRDRLDSWKDIAAYLGRDVRTAIRWQGKGLPVHRVPGGKRAAVFAYPAEIDQWLVGKTANGSPVAVEEDGDGSVAVQTSPTDPGLSQPALTFFRSNGRRPLFIYLGLVLLAVVLLAAALLTLSFFPKSGKSLEVPTITQLTHDGLFKMGLATDGNNIYFGELASGRRQLLSMPIAGSSQSAIPTPFAKAGLQDIDVTHGVLLVLGYNGIEDETALWLVPVNGQPPSRAGDIMCHSAASSADGKAILYARARSIFVSTDQGATSRELHQFDSDPYNLSWSKSTNRVRFLLRNPTTFETSAWEMEVGPSYEFRSMSRFDLPIRDCCGVWVDTPDYEFFATGDDHVLVVPQKKGRWRQMQPKTVRLSSVGTVSELVPDPRTSRLFVIGTAPGRGELLRFEPFSRSFSPFLSGVPALYPDISRDGGWMTYRALDRPSLWIVRTDGNEKKELISEGSFADIELPRWSADATQIAFNARRSGGPWRIYVVQRTGGNPREVSSNDDNQGAPTWSPDGKWLAYGNVACAESHTCAIHRVELDTGIVDTLPGSNGLRTARWSPDGHYIAALRPDRHQLLLFDLKRQNWAIISDSVAGDDLSWSQDSRYLYTVRPVGDRPEIVRFSRSGGTGETVVDLAALSKLTGRFDVGLCVAPDNAIILTRQINSSEIYALDWNGR